MNNALIEQTFTSFLHLYSIFFPKEKWLSTCKKMMQHNPKILLLLISVYIYIGKEIFPIR
jgi:hypothetical protein